MLAIDSGLLRGRTVQSSSPVGNSADANAFTSASEDVVGGFEFSSRVALSTNLALDVDVASVTQPEFQIAVTPTLQLQAVDADVALAFKTIDRVFESGLEDESEIDVFAAELSQFDTTVI